MTDKHSAAVAAAITLFSRYGVKKTSMASVADEAGVSRQTLYALFPSKDSLIAAAMRQMIDQIEATLSEEWKSSTSIEEVLDVYLTHSVLNAFQLLCQAPDLKDLLHGIGPDTIKLAEKAEIEKAALLGEQLQAYENQLNTHGISAKELARFIVRTCNELKFTAKTKKELLELLKTLRASVLAVCKE